MGGKGVGLGGGKRGGGRRAMRGWRRERKGKRPKGPHIVYLSTMSHLYDRSPERQFLAHLSQRLKWAIVIAHRPSSVRPSVIVVRRKLSHFRLLLQNRLMDFDETWYAWITHGPLQVLLFFGQIRPGVDPGRGQNRSRGVPFFKKLLLQTGRLQGQTECIAMI